MHPGPARMFGIAALAAGCSVELAALESPADAALGGNGGIADGSFGGAGGGGTSNAGSGGNAGDASAGDGSDASDAGDAGDAADAPTGVVLCSVDFEASKCFDAYNLFTNGNAHCGPGGALSGNVSGTLEGGNNTSMAKADCGHAPADLWFELLYRRDSPGSVTFEVGELGFFGNRGAQVTVGAGGNLALLECLDGKDATPLVPSELSTPYVITVHFAQSGQVELWHRQRSPLTPRGTPHATVSCPQPQKNVGWQASGGALTTLDDIRIASAASSLVYK